MTRSVAEFLRDNRASKTAQADYREDARRLSELAVLMTEIGDRRRAAELRYLASIAANAARAEWFQPDTPGYPPVRA
jgi:hypothetical protein